MSLAQLLTDGHRFDAEYAAGLSNHLPMALVALASLGADDARLAAFALGYARRLPPAPAAAEWPAGDAWKSRLGERDAWPAYRALFDQWLFHEDAAAVLGQVLPPLMQGVGAVAFHGPIRTAAALRAGHRGELADALAYWACRWLDLGASHAVGRVADPARLLPRLPAGDSAAGLIVERMREGAAQRGFAPVVAQLVIADDTLGRLARTAAQLHAASGNFTALHLVTSAHAMRLLLPFVEEPLPALRAYWRAYAAGVMASRIKPTRVADVAATALPWPELLAAALASDDEHLIKLVDASREEQQAYGGADDWQRAATRAVRDARQP